RPLIAVRPGRVQPLPPRQGLAAGRLRMAWKAQPFRPGAGLFSGQSARSAMSASPIIAPFPAHRLRRLRRTAALRAMVEEVSLSPANLIWPIFVTEVAGAEGEIASMPGVERLTLDGARRAAETAMELDIPAVCVFPHSDQALRTETCERAWDAENIGNRAIRAIKAVAPELAVMTDIALDPYN